MFKKKFLLLYTLSSILCIWMQPTISQNSIRQNKSRMTRLRERALKFGRCVVGTREFKSEEKQIARATFLLLIGGSLGVGYLLKRHLQGHVPSGPPSSSSSSSDSEGVPSPEPADPPSPPADGSSSSGEEDRGSLSAAEEEEGKAEEDTHRKEEDSNRAEEEKEEKEKIPLRWEWVREGFFDPNSHDPVRASWTRATFAYCFGR